MAVFDVQILVRMRKSERERIHTEAKLRGMSANDYIRFRCGLNTEGGLQLEDRVVALEQRVANLEK